MRQDVPRIDDAEVMSHDYNTGEIEIRISAVVPDMVQTAPAILYPPDIAEPAQYGPAHCTATVTVCLDDVQWEVAE